MTHPDGNGPMAAAQILASSSNELLTPKGLAAPEESEGQKPGGELAPGAADSSRLKSGNKPSQRPTQMKSYKCRECQESFKDQAELVKHLKAHARQRSWRCPACKKSFSKKSSLLIHQRSHTDSKHVACRECGKTFAQTASLLVHSKTHLLKKAKNGRNYAKKYRKEEPHRCLECAKTFVFHNNFIKHQRIHATSMAHKQQAVHLSLGHRDGAEKEVLDLSGLLLEELTKMRQNVDMLLLNQQSQLCVLQEIQKQLGVLLPGNDLINSNVYNLGLLLGQQAAAVGSVSFPLFLSPSNLLPEGTRPLSPQVSF